MTDLTRKSVIITGAGQGLGRAYALASAASGASVVVSDVNGAAAAETAAEISAAGGRAVAIEASVTSWADSARVVDLCLSEFGALDGLVANAAIMHMAAPWDETEARLRAIVEVNVLGVQFVVAHGMKAMVEAGAGGSIVTVVSGAQHGIRGMSAYGATKGAVNAMTRNWAIEGSDHGIRVNAISPIGRTQMTLDHTTEPAESYPLPERIAPLVVSLLSDATSGLTGRLLRFDGSRLSEYVTETRLLAERGDWDAGTLASTLHADAPVG